MLKHILALGILAAALAPLSARAVERAPQGVIPHTRGGIVMDGKLDDWGGAFATPVNFGHANWEDRAAVWRYLWDEQNLYIGLDCLDSAIFNTDPGPIYDGDGVEFYLDLRDPAHLADAQWSPGALHLFYTPASNGQIKPRIQIRPGIPAFADVTAAGMEAAAMKTERGYTIEFRLPWSKVPGFRPAAGREIGIDCELCSSDGAKRVDRCWVYGGVADVGGPASFGRMVLQPDWDAAKESAAYSEVLFPSFVARSTPLNEPATLFVGLSPAVQDLVNRVEVTARGKALPFTMTKRFGPGWTRLQTCLVGFVGPDESSIEARFLAADGRVIGKRTIPLK